MNFFLIFSYGEYIAGHADVLKYLLEEGCNPNLVDMYGQSPLHIAALSGNLPAIKLLYQGKMDHIKQKDAFKHA